MASADSSQVKRPLVAAGERAFKGETRESADFYDPMVAQDYTFVPGYSDKRRINDERMRKGQAPLPMPYRFQLVPTTKPNGQPDNRRVAEWSMKGYRKVSKADIESGSLGIKMPPAAVITADGAVRIGDSDLMYCGADNAAKEEARGRSAIEARNADDNAAQDLHRAGREVARPGENLTYSETERTLET